MHHLEWHAIGEKYCDKQATNNSRSNYMNEDSYTKINTTLLEDAHTELAKAN